jgi:putative sterol carrier protein
MATYETIDDVIESYPDRFQPDQAEGVEGIVQLNLTGEGGGHYYMLIEDQTLDIEEGEHDDPTVAVTTSADDWLKINNGQTNAMALMMQGKLKVSGSLPMATKFQSIFRSGG